MDYNYVCGTFSGDIFSAVGGNAVGNRNYMLSSSAIAITVFLFIFGTVFTAAGRVNTPEQRRTRMLISIFSPRLRFVKLRLQGAQGQPVFIYGYGLRKDSFVRGLSEQNKLYICFM